MKSSLKGASKVEIIYETLWLLEKRRTMLLLSLLFSRRGEGKKWKPKEGNRRWQIRLKICPGNCSRFLISTAKISSFFFFFNDTFPTWNHGSHLSFIRVTHKTGILKNYPGSWFIGETWRNLKKNITIRGSSADCFLNFKSSPMYY